MNLARKLTVTVWSDGHGDAVTFHLLDVAAYLDFPARAHDPEAVIVNDEDGVTASLSRGLWVTLVWRKPPPKGTRAVDLLLLYPQG